MENKIIRKVDHRKVSCVHEHNGYRKEWETDWGGGVGWKGVGVERKGKTREKRQCDFWQRNVETDSPMNSEVRTSALVPSPLGRRAAASRTRVRIVTYGGRLDINSACSRALFRFVSLLNTPWWQRSAVSVRTRLFALQMARSIRPRAREDGPSQLTKRRRHEEKRTYFDWTHNGLKAMHLERECFVRIGIAHRFLRTNTTWDLVNEVWTINTLSLVVHKAARNFTASSTSIAEFAFDSRSRHNIHRRNSRDELMVTEGDHYEIRSQTSVRPSVWLIREHRTGTCVRNSSRSLSVLGRTT